MTQEFHLSITSLGSDRYLIRTEDTAAGVPIAEAQVQWPVEDWLKQAKPAMDDPVLGLLQGTIQLGDRAAGLHQLGRQLYDALFQQDDAIRESWLRAQGIAQNRHEILRLRLGLKESRLQRLPWEALRHDQQPITTRSNQTFVRYSTTMLVGQSSESLALPEADFPVRVLMVIASPHDQDHLKLLQEVRHIQDLLETTGDRPTPIQITVLEQPDRSQLAQKLEQGNFQVLHYAGHSDFGQNGGDLSLVNQQTGLTERLSGDDLAGLLVNNHVALTIFNSCRSGHIAGDDADMDWRQQNLVQALVDRGVPSVIAMAERIPDQVAITFTRLFYHNLLSGLPIDVSLSRTRQGLISGFGSDQHYWALPILYMHPDFDGYLSQGDRAEADTLDPTRLAISTSPLTTVDPPPPPPTDPSPPDSAADEPASPEEASTPLLTQLAFSDPAERSDDELLTRYVQQLSKNASTPDEPLIPASAEEVLFEDDSQRAGMAIYDRLPDVPAQSKPSPAPSGDTATATSLPPQTPAHTPPQPLYAAPRSTSPLQRQAEKPIIVWFALGLIGLVGVIGLSFLAMRWAGNGFAPGENQVETTSPIAEPEPASPDAFSLIRRAENAIADRRYADAREDFERAMTQSLIGEAVPQEVNDAIWPWVSNTDISDLQYIKGRIYWQEISQIESDIQDYESLYQQRTFAGKAREAWEMTDDTFLEGRVARGFAAYADGDLDAAVDHWDAALRLYEAQRQRQPNPAGTSVADPIILHAYAGLVMAHTKLGNINPAGLEEDPRLRAASETDQSILTAEAEKELSVARDYFLLLRDRDEFDWVTPGNLGLINESEYTWNNWLWTADLLEDWRRDYRYWDTETSIALPDSQ